MFQDACLTAIVNLQVFMGTLFYSYVCRVVQELLSHQIGLISSKDGRGRTVLHLAARKGHEKTAEEIIKHCPRIDEK